MSDNCVTGLCKNVAEDLEKDREYWKKKGYSMEVLDKLIKDIKDAGADGHS